MATFNNKECLETKQGKYTTTQRSKLEQVYRFQNDKRINKQKFNMRAKHSIKSIYCLY